MSLILTPITTTGLTTLANVKAYMEVTATTWDAKLTALLSAASQGIETYCDRSFASASVVEYRNGSESWRAGYLSLNNYPVTSIARVAIEPKTCVLITCSSSNIQRATVNVTSEGLVLTTQASGVESNTTLLFATYTTLSALATAISAIGNGWGCVVAPGYSLYGSSYLKAPQGALWCLNQPAEIELYTTELSNYRLETSETTGTLYGHFPNGFQNIEIRYTAGYATIPDSVQTATCMVVKALYDMSKNDAGMQSEKIGEYSYTRRALSGDFDMPVFADARLLLAPYKRVRFM